MRNFILIFATALILTIILTWPFAANLTSYYTDQGDYPLNGAVLWFNQYSIKTGRIFNQKEYFRGYQFYPQPYSLAFGNNALVPSLIFAPIYWLTNNLPFSVNFFVLLTLILSFLTSFYSINYFVKNKWASLVGAAIYTFNPETLVRFPQHMDILNKYFLPLIFLFAYRFFEKPNFKNSILFFLLFTLNALSVNYYLIFSTTILPMLFIPFLITQIRKKNWGYFINLFKFSLVFLIFIPIILYFDLPYLQFSSKEGAQRRVEETTFFSARINDFFGSTPDNLIYGGWTKYLEQIRSPKDDRGILNYEEHTLFLNILPVILFILGFKAFLKEKIHKSYFYILLILTFIFTFGPKFPADGEGGVNLPFYYLYQIMPILKGIRSPSRFEFLFYIPFALIASFGAKWIMEKKRIWVVGVIGLILILENFTVRNYDDRSKILAQMTQLDTKLVFLQDKVTLHLPIYTTDDADEFGKNSAYLNWLTKTGERLFNGNSAYLPPDQLYLLAQIKNNLDQKALEELVALGVNYIVIHKDLSPKDYPILQKGLTFNMQGIEIYELSKLGLHPQVCNFDKDIDIKVAQARDENFNLSLALNLKNKSGCFLASLFDDRYRKMEVDGIKKMVYFRLPILIGPGEEIVLNEINREVRVQ